MRRPVSLGGMVATPAILPSLGGMVPAVQPVAPTEGPATVPNAGIGAGQELFSSQPYPFPYPGAPDGAGEVTVYTTKNAWQGCDVYVSFGGVTTSGPGDKILFGGVVSLFVYGITQSGGRALVASGRVKAMQVDAAPSFILIPNQWVCAARSIAQRFEVTLSYAYSSAAPIPVPPPANPLVVTVAASDECVDPPTCCDDVGVVPAAPTMGVGISVGSPFPKRPELVGVEAINGGGAARYLMYFEMAGAIPNGTVPIMAWPMGSASGQGVTDWVVRRRAPLGSFQLVVSSTPLSLTRVADSLVQAFYR